MNVLTTMQQRHSVRRFSKEPLSAQEIGAIEALVSEANAESGLHIQFMANRKVSFASIIGLATYGNFANVNNYLALVCRPTPDARERLGFYGEKIVLALTEMGLGTCWVGGSLSRRFTKAERVGDETLNLVILVGHIGEPGKAHHSKGILDMCRLNGQPMPEWFHRGMVGVELAPSAMNHQDTVFELMANGLNQVRVHPGKRAFNMVDAGIAKYHFLAMAGRENFSFIG